MQQRFKLGRVVQISFSSIFIILVGIGAVSRLTMEQIITSSDWVSHTYEVEADLTRIERLLVDAETGQRGFLLTGRENYLDPYNNAVTELEDLFDKISGLIQDNPTQLARLRKVEELTERKLDELEQTIALAQSKRREEAMKLVLSDAGKQYMDDIRQELTGMVQAEEQLLTEREQMANQAALTANWVSWGGGLLVIALGSAALWFISREVIRPINQVANAIASSSNEIAATIEQQERTATQQAASVNETTTTIDELSASAQQSAQQAEAASLGSLQVLALATQGNQSADSTLENMAILTRKVSAVADQILRLSEQTNQIGSISGIVSDLANQTNMLALNAAVEAVRAGEQGKGFAVVASEIRKLAEQSKRSAEKINGLVGDIQTAINSTVIATDESTQTATQNTQVTQQTVDVFGEVSEAINSVVLNIQQISLNAKQQATAVQQIVQAMNSLNVAARETASGIGQTRVSTHQLNEAAQKLQAVV